MNIERGTARRNVRCSAFAVHGSMFPKFHGNPAIVVPTEGVPLVRFLFPPVARCQSHSTLWRAVGEGELTFFAGARRRFFRRTSGTNPLSFDETSDGGVRLKSFSASLFDAPRAAREVLRFYYVPVAALALRRARPRIARSRPSADAVWRRRQTAK